MGEQRVLGRQRKYDYDLVDLFVVLGELLGLFDLVDDFRSGGAVGLALGLFSGCVSFL